MARMPEVEPVETVKGDRREQSHPAYGQINANRISGQRTLYGSDFLHNSFVRISVYESKLERSHYRDWPHATMLPLIEVDLSEAQWGAFVSSFGVGEGTQCTLNAVGDERKPGIPLQERARLHFGEGDETIRKALADLKVLRGKIEAGTQGLSKVRQADMLKEVDASIRSLSDSLPFIARSFAEEMEKTVEKAKTEVHAYVTNTIMRAGLDAIGSGEPPIAISAPTSSDPA